MPHTTDRAALEEVRSKVESAYAAWLKFSRFSQEQVDAVVESVAAAGRREARRLAEMAVRETGYGNVEDKTGKNLLCSEWLLKQIRNMRTVGLLREVAGEGIFEYAVPLGVVAAIVPTTNPTSTVICKSLISLKAGNAIVISPHPHARASTFEAAEVLHRAAVAAGAPEGLIQCLSQPDLESTQALMRHERVAVILATGGHGMVRAAYSSGKPAFGVGPGNVPVLLDSSASLPEAVAKFVQGKTFDYGTVCSSEQTVVAETGLRDSLIAELKANSAHICTESQREALAALLITPSGSVNAKCVGQSPQRIASMAGFEVPPETSILAVEIQGVGRGHPLSAEKLSPVLALLFVQNFSAALDACEAVLRFGGLGHTCVIHARDEARIHEYARRMPAMRVLVNTPSPQGSVGITTNLLPSMTLGCGAAGGNSTGDNVGPLHLINIKRVAYMIRRPEDAFVVPPAGAASEAPSDIVDRFLASRRPFIPTHAPLPQPCAATVPVSAPSRPPTPIAPEIAIVPFVCESDVREAMRESRKIYIGPKTIVTPAARELADRYDILIQAQR
jgi:acyl-CoA reductase-like NAD-dependent aldehyde dehydrogenase